MWSCSCCFRFSSKRTHNLKFKALSYSSPQNSAVMEPRRKMLEDARVKIPDGTDTSDEFSQFEDQRYRHSPDTAMKYHFDINSGPFLSHQRSRSGGALSINNSSSAHSIVCEHNVKFSLCARCGNNTMKQLFLGGEGNIRHQSSSLPESGKQSGDQGSREVFDSGGGTGGSNSKHHKKSKTSGSSRSRSKAPQQAGAVPQQMNPFADVNDEPIKKKLMPQFCVRKDEVHSERNEQQNRRHKRSMSDTFYIVKRNPFESSIRDCPHM